MITIDAALEVASFGNYQFWELPVLAAARNGFAQSLPYYTAAISCLQHWRKLAKMNFMTYACDLDGKKHGLVVIK